jgi:hypothetical protein
MNPSGDANLVPEIRNATAGDAPPFLQAKDSIPGLDECTVGDFWQWAYSDVLSNRNRSIFAEYIVGVALGVDKPRVGWDAFDLQYAGFKIEVKSSAYCQSWFQKKPSTILFSIRKAVFWNPETGTYEGEATRSADLYVFCVHAEKDKVKANVPDVATWDFYVVATATLNREFGAAKSLSLAAGIPVAGNAVPVYRALGETDPGAGGVADQ